MPQRIDCLALVQDTLALSPELLDYKQRYNFERRHVLLEEFLDWHKNGRDENKWKKQFRHSTELKLVACVLAEYCDWAFNTKGLSQISIYTSIIGVRKALPAAEHKLSFARSVVGGYKTKELIACSDHFKKTQKTIQRIAGGKDAGKRKYRLLTQQDAAKMIKTLKPDPHGLRMRALMLMAPQIIVQSYYW
jgi:hypothetical protein